MRLYDVSARAVKSVDPLLRVGGPATAAAGWIGATLEHVAKSGAALDYLSTHTYGNAPLDVRATAVSHGLGQLPIWWTEWGVTPTHFGPVNDPVFGAPFICHSMKSVQGRAEAAAYWVISDHFEELGRPERLFHGGFGLLTVGNLRKPRYWALRMLELLHDDLVACHVSGDGAGGLVDAWATRHPDGRIAVLVWNETLDQSRMDGDALLEREVTVRIERLPTGGYELRHRRVARVTRTSSGPQRRSTIPTGRTIAVGRPSQRSTGWTTWSRSAGSARRPGGRSSPFPCPCLASHYWSSGRAPDLLGCGIPGLLPIAIGRPAALPTDDPRSSPQIVRSASIRTVEMASNRLAAVRSAARRTVGADRHIPGRFRPASAPHYVRGQEAGRCQRCADPLTPEPDPSGQGGDDGPGLRQRGRRGQRSLRALYDRAVSSKATDPNLLYDAQTTLGQHDVYDDADLKAFAEAYFDPASTQDRLHSALVPPVDRFAELDDPSQHEFRGRMRDYVRLYAFLSQVVTFVDADLERLYVFGRYLLRKLPADGQKLPYEVQQAIDMASYGVRRTSSGGIELGRGKAGLSPMAPKDVLAPAVEQLEPLSAIIRELNDPLRHGRDRGRRSNRQATGRVTGDR